MVRYSDAEIGQLLQEPKTLPSDLGRRMQKLRPKRGHRELNVDLTGAQGSHFRLIIRQGTLNSLDFSLILALVPPRSTQLFRLRRYNGKSHQHRNLLEKTLFYDYHIHTATERYQNMGAEEDAYAEPTSAYQDLFGALQALLAECNFQQSDENQPGLFNGY